MAQYALYYLVRYDISLPPNLHVCSHNNRCQGNPSLLKENFLSGLIHFNSVSGLIWSSSHLSFYFQPSQSKPYLLLDLNADWQGMAMHMPMPYACGTSMIPAVCLCSACYFASVCQAAEAQHEANHVSARLACYWQTVIQSFLLLP